MGISSVAGHRARGREQLHDLGEAELATSGLASGIGPDTQLPIPPFHLIQDSDMARAGHADLQRDRRQATRRLPCTNTIS